MSTTSASSIPMPASTAVSTSATQSVSAYMSSSVNPQAAQYGYYTAEQQNQYNSQYQQYYQQYYANAYAQPLTAYAQQQYAAGAYYQPGSVTNPTAYNSVNGYGTTPNSYLPGTYASIPNGKDIEHDAAEDDDDDDDPTIAKTKSTKPSNTLPYHCNEKMGLNPLIYTNIQQSPYFKNNLFQLKTYHEVIDEIYYNVKHLEPWEKGSRKVSGQTGMCGSVRGVGAGGIISTPYCLLYKLFTLRLTRKQVNGLIRHKDSPYIRALGFMYIRYTQPPQDLWQWFESFLHDEEEIDPKAGGGSSMTIGEMVRYFLTKLDWFSTLFPRVPIPIQKEIEEKLRNFDKDNRGEGYVLDKKKRKNSENKEDKFDRGHGYKQQHYRSDSNNSKRENRSKRSRSRSPVKHNRRSKNYDDYSGRYSRNA